MAAFDVDWQLPVIDLELCDGCGKCVQICPSQALALKDGKAFIVAPQDCGYYGFCESVCPPHAITRPFLIVS
jgi:ferredoxin